ncbi:MAG TPA: hypothetical protein VKB93_09240 [Thermoanaerobaculia bacterium]|nr:hypothetical protein [Thermoanaerobaculia bacterium]
MTLHRIEHAVVMDTDDIPGRGGYALVGVSHGVRPEERAFVAQNFGISDYLHDPQRQSADEQRVFYSFFRIPGGRRAFVRRFAKGMRRNQTQNRLFVHTLFIDDALYERLHGLPWLLINASVRLEGARAWERLRDEIALAEHGTEHDGWIPHLEWDDGDGAADQVTDALRKRLTLAGEENLAAVITTLSKRKRVQLPQGRNHELLAMLAWSMLPWLDREEIAWTQHDTMNLSGVTFDLANVPRGAAELDAAASFALDIVHKCAAEETWLDFQARSKNMTVRNPAVIARWLEWRKGVDALPSTDAMRALAATAKGNEDAPWIDREEILDLVWKKPGEVASSGLHRVVLRAAPERRWLDRAAADTGADTLVSNLLLAAGDDPVTAPARTALAAWVAENALDEIPVERFADLVSGLPRDAREQWIERVTQWLFAEPERTLPLGRAIMHRHPNAAPLAIALASAGEPASTWFGALLERASAIDAAKDASAASFFHQAIQRLGSRPIQLQGAVDPLLRTLETTGRAGDCTRALILLLRPEWKTRGRDLPKLVYELLKEAPSVAGWETVVAALAEDFAKSQKTGISALVAMYWLKVTEPSLVPRLDRAILDALRQLTDKDRDRVAAAWETLVRYIPAGEAFDLLYDLLYGERAAGPRIQRALREIDQGIADEQTLNQLDAALYAKHGDGYAHDLADAIERYIAGGSPSRRLQRLGALLAADRVQQTVKRVIEVHVLPKAVARLRASDWKSAMPAMGDLLKRGVPRLTIASAIRATADRKTLQAFKDTYGSLSM